MARENRIRQRHRLYCQVCGELAGDCAIRSHPAAMRRHRERKHPEHVDPIAYGPMPPGGELLKTHEREGGTHAERE